MPPVLEKEQTVTPPPAEATQQILLRGVHEHNLKHLDVDIPLNQLTVITGPSGCGKSSLAFDTLHAEGKRRFMESLSSYARQFMDQFQKAKVDEVRNIPPAIGLAQHNPVTNARATVGTNTDAVDFLAQLFYAAAQQLCPACGSTRLLNDDPRRLAGYLFETLESGTPLYLGFLLPRKRMKHCYDALFSAGFDRILDTALKPVTLGPEMPTWKQELVHEGLQIAFLLDRFKFAPENTDALTERFAQAYHRLARFMQESPEAPHIQLVAWEGKGENAVRRPLAMGAACFDCGHALAPMDVQHYHYMYPQGACETCDGFGRTMGLDTQRVIPNPRATIRGGAVHPLQIPSYYDVQLDLEAACKREGIPVTLAWHMLKEEDRQKIWDGFGTFIGIRGFFDYLETKKYKMHVRMHLARYRGYFECTACHGSRLKPQARSATLMGKTLTQWLSLPVSELKQFMQEQPDETLPTQSLARDAWDGLLMRLQWLEAVGLGYLSLLRPVRTLSSGEAHRVQLIASLGSELTETLYVLDEPTVGLHPRDTKKLMQVLKQLRDLGNTVVLVEHDADVIREADYIFDLGPGSGAQGGEIVFQGTYPALLKSGTKTAGGLLQLLEEGGLASSEKGETPSGWLRIYGAKGYNLKDVSVAFPLGRLTCVSGVSGAGKSSLILQTLYGHWLNSQSELPSFEVLPCDGVEGLEHFTGGVILVDQSAPARSSRSNPATVVKAYDEIRKLFASSAKAKALGITPGHFSFNSKGGRCEACEGLGYLTIDMQFMADMQMECPDCRGRRFQESVLAIDLFGRNIDDVLKMTVDEAMQFFKTAPKIRERLLPLVELGLGYLPMGQATATLSGGEAQRLKLAPYLPRGNKNASKPCLFIFDEPTRGLHMTDVPVLVQALHRLREAGHTVIVIEHNPQFLALAGDWFMDIGPGADADGGEVVYEGKLTEFLKTRTSETARSLKALLS